MNIPISNAPTNFSAQNVLMSSNTTRIYGFYLNMQKELICVYEGDPPDMYINDAGELIWRK